MKKRPSLKRVKALPIAVVCASLALASLSTPIFAQTDEPLRPIELPADDSLNKKKRTAHDFRRGIEAHQFEPKQHLKAAERSHHRKLSRKESPRHKPAESSFNVTVSDVVAHDRVRIVLSTQVDAITQSDVNERLTQSVRQTFDAIGEAPNVTLTSGTFRVSPRHDASGLMSSWHGHAQVLIDSHDFDLASELAVRAAQQMAISNVSFYVSEELRSRAEGILVARAGEAFQERAGSLASSLGFDGFRIKAVSLNNQGVVQPSRPMARFASADMAESMVSRAVPMEGGEERVSVTLSGSVDMYKKRKSKRDSYR